MALEPGFLVSLVLSKGISQSAFCAAMEIELLAKVAVHILQLWIPIDKVEILKFFIIGKRN